METLISTIDEPSIGDQIERAARQHGIRSDNGEPTSAHYEHGQWWVLAGIDSEDSPLTYSVVDAEPGHGLIRWNGDDYPIDFERV